MKLIFKTWIPTLNEYINLERRNKYSAAELKRLITGKINMYTKQQTKEKLTSCYDLDVLWIRTDKMHDPDNVYFGIKFILDGIVSSKVLEGDSRKYIRNINNTITQGKYEQVEIIFKDVNEL